MKTNQVSLRPFQAGVDGALFEEWLRRPHVVRWWGDPERQLASSLNRAEGADHVVILAGEDPVGYLRWQPANISYLKSLGIDGVPPGAMDIDIFLADSETTGKGIGTAALQLLLANLSAQPDIPAAGMSTSVENAPAIRAYEKAGFKRLCQYDDPDFGRCWIMMTLLH